MSRRSLFAFLGRRLTATVLLLLVISFVIFSLLYLSPGDPITNLLAGEPSVSAEERRQVLIERYHLDEPFFVQYWLWLKNAAQLELGESIARIPVTDEIFARLPASLFLGLYAYIVTMLLGVPLGIWSALKQRSLVDRTIVGGTMVGLATPAYVSGVFMIFLFSIQFRWFPTSGRGTGFADEIWHLTLPALSVGLLLVAAIVKYVRAALISVIDSDYVTFARARGLSWLRVVLLYGLRNALIPLVTLAAPLLAFLLAGALFVEVTFSYPGLGDLFVRAANAEDLPMIQGIALYTAAMILLANLFADLLYVVIDPRIRLGGRGT